MTLPSSCYLVKTGPLSEVLPSTTCTDSSISKNPPQKCSSSWF